MKLFRFLICVCCSFVFFNLVAEKQIKAVPEPPKIIELPKTENKTVDLFKKFSFIEKEKRDNSFVKKLEELKDNLIPIRFSEIPVFDYVPMPKKIKTFFTNLVIYLPDIKFNLNGEFSIEGQVDLYDISVQARIFVGKNKQGKNFYSISVNLPKGWKFSDAFPKTKWLDPTLMDLLRYKSLWFMFSTEKYKDDFFDKEVLSGLNFLGDLKATGKLFEKLDVLFKGKLSKLPAITISGTIGLDPRMVGTTFKIDLPIGITFNKNLKTTPLSLIFFVEEKITLIPTIALAIKGGLNVLFKGQEEPVKFNLIGKYIFPEDLEFYGQMEGSLKNFIIKDFTIGDLKLGIVTDIALIIETSGLFGWVAGLSFNGAAGMGKSNFSFGAKGDLSGDSGIGDLTFVFNGSSYLKDLARFWLSTIKRTTKSKLNIDKIVSIVPNIEMENISAVFVPRKTIEEEKRTEINIGRANIFGLEGSGSFFLSQDGFRGSIKLPEIIIGSKKNPLFFITGAGEKGKRGLVIEVDLRLSDHRIYGDLLWGTSLFGGLSHHERVDISASGFDVASSFRWNGVVDASVIVNIDLTEGFLQPENLIAKINVKQDGLDTISDYLRKSAEHLLRDLRSELDRIKKESLQKLKITVKKSEITTLQRIYALEHSINRKIKLCNTTFSKGLTKILRPACYAVMDVVGDVIKLLHMRFRRDVTLNVIMVGGKAAIEIVNKTSKTASRSIGDVMKFLSKLTRNIINVRRFKLEASFKQLQEKKPLILKSFDANLLGKRVLLKNIAFDLQKIKEFIIALFDHHKKK